MITNFFETWTSHSLNSLKQLIYDQKCHFFWISSLISQPIISNLMTKKSGYIFCRGESYYCDSQSQHSRVGSLCNQSWLCRASHWALLHTRLHSHHTCKHKGLYAHTASTQTHTHTHLPISTGPPTHFHPLHHLSRYPNTPSWLLTVSHSDEQPNRNSRAF